MAAHCRFLVFVALLLLCFASTTSSKGRSVRVVHMKEAEERPKDLLSRDSKLQGSEELVTMDYNTASKKTPIHN